MKKNQKIGFAAVGVAAFFIIGLAAGAARTAPASNTSAIASASTLASAAADDDCARGRAQPAGELLSADQRRELL